MPTSTFTATGFCLGGLITASEYYSMANISGTPSNAAQIQAAINFASDKIRNDLGRMIVTIGDGISIVEVENGADTWLYFPRQAPVVSVTSAEYYNGTDWSSVDSAVHELYTDGNIISTREKTLVFTRGFQNWRFTYTIGWPSIPEDLKYAVYMTARTLIDRANKRSDLQSQSDSEQSFSYFSPRQLAIPEEALDILVRYHRHRPIYRY